MPQSSSQNFGRTSIPAPSIPETEPISAIAARVKSLVRNTLLASPDFPRLYADVVISSAPNSNEAKILARNYKKIIELTLAKTNIKAAQTEPVTNVTVTNIEANRTPMPNVKTCTHIKVTGIRCGSPALRGEQFCYFHQRMLRTVTVPKSRLHPVAMLENEEAIQASIMEVVNALIRGTIELRRGELILRALNAAVRNARRVRFDNTTKMVTQVPDYTDQPTAETTHPETTHVGTEAFARPASPDVLDRGDPSTNKNAAVDPTQPKPPASDRSAQVKQNQGQRQRTGVSAPHEQAKGVSISR
jgi:hypothetical protein